jgi:hypothetical protein
MRLVAAALAALLTVGCAAPVAEAPAPVSPQPELNSPSLLCPLAVATGLPSQPAVTKTFTVMALLQLVDQGQVSSLPGTRALTLRSDRYRALTPLERTCPAGTARFSSFIDAVTARTAILFTSSCISDAGRLGNGFGDSVRVIASPPSITAPTCTSRYRDGEGQGARSCRCRQLL